MEGLIAVGLWMIDPVAKTVGVTLVDLVERDVNLETLVHFLLPLQGDKDNAHGQDVIDFLKCDVFVLHLRPNGIWSLDACLDGIFESHLVECLTDGSRKIVKEFVAVLLGEGKLLFDFLIFLGMLKLEAQIFQLILNLVQSQPVSQRRIDIKRLTSNLVLLIGRLRRQCAHVVQTVADLDENDSNIVAHCEQKLLEVLCLCRCLVAENTTRDFGQSVDDAGYFRSEDILYILHRIVSILHDIVKEGGANRRRSEPHFLTGNLSHGYGMHDVGLARQPSDAFMCLPGKVERFGDDIHLLAMTGG